MILWLILILSTTFSCVLALDAAVNVHAYKAARDSYQGQGMRGKYLVGCFAPLSAAAVACLWCVYSVQVSDWRFGAIAWAPVLANLIVRLVAGRKPTTVADVEASQ